MIPLVVIMIYLALLLGLGLFSAKFFKGTSKDYFVASHSIGPFLLLMSIFGTTMTAFALVGSTGKAYERGIGVYGLMASSSALVHAGVFFFIGIKIWAIGKRNGYVTQIQFFRERFESNKIGYLLFPILIGLIIPYLLIGVMGACKVILPATTGAFPEVFQHVATPQFAGGIPYWLTGLAVCLVVLTYIFAGGSRATAWANAFQTIVFMVMGLVAFNFIANALGGLAQAAKVPMTITANGDVVQTYGYDRKAKAVMKLDKPKVIGFLLDDKLPKEALQPHLSRAVHEVALKKVDRKTKAVSNIKRDIGVPSWMFFTYFFIPLSVGMFPHLFQHWLTARSAESFRLTILAHPICIMIVWVPCVLIGVWATGILPPSVPSSAVLPVILKMLVENPLLSGLMTAGIMAAIMSSLDSQFLCLGTIFTSDIVLHNTDKNNYSDKKIILISRLFIIVIVAATYGFAMLALKNNVNIFDLAVWCFSGFASLFPLIFAALYWRGTTKIGAYASIITAVVVWFYYFRLSGFGGEYTILHGVMPVAVSFTASAVMIVVVSLMTTPPSKETIDKFFGDVKSR